MLRCLQAHIKALANGESRPFPDVVLCNIGNPQSVGQQPLTFPRQVRAPRGTVFTRSRRLAVTSGAASQVLALCTCPSLLDNPQIVDALPADVVARAKRILDGTHGLGARCLRRCPDSTQPGSLALSRCFPGAYSDSKGIESARESVKAYIEERDGHPTDIEGLYLTNGASEGVKTLLNMLISGPNDGVMIPIPQYPLYSATITALGGAQIGYFLDEGNDWAMTTANLDEVAAQARADGITPRALCIINPVRTRMLLAWVSSGGWLVLMWAGMRVQGNPTGQVMSEQNIAEVIDWSASHPHPTSATT